MATVTINIHPVQDRFSAIVYWIGRWSGGVTRQFLHAQICVELGEHKVCYDLRDKGVARIELPDPSVSYRFEVSATRAKEMITRVQVYEVEGHKVSFCSLMRAMLFPNKINYDICTSFVEYVFTGEVTTNSNRIHTFMKDKELLCHLQTTKE